MEDAGRTKAQEIDLKILKEAEEAETKARQLAETAKQEETEKEKEKGRRQIQELLARRYQEEIKFKQSVKAIDDLMKTGDAAGMKHLLEAVRNAQRRLGDRMTACERAQEVYISSLIDKEVAESESHWIATTLGEYNRICDKTEIFISQNSSQKETPTSHDKPEVSTSGIKLEKLKFDPFRGNLKNTRDLERNF